MSYWRPERWDKERRFFLQSPSGKLVESIYKLSDRTLSWHIQLGVASPIATVSDFAPDLTGIDFPITAARIKKFNRSTNFDASKIREEGFKQLVSNEDALRKTVEWHLHHEYGESLMTSA